MKYRIVDNSGLAFAEFLGLRIGTVLESDGHRHPITGQLILNQPKNRGLVMMDDKSVELVNE